MGSHNSKTECIWLPGQSGKTRNIMERIKALEVAADEYDCHGFLNIIICSNNRSLVDQTDKRMNKELFSDDEENEVADSKIDGNCFKWHSGLKNNNVSVGELADNIKEGKVTMVVCCAHSKRLSYLYSLIQNLDKSRLFTKRVNVWIDEADASIKLWSKETLDISSFSVVHKITLVSATFDSILKNYGKIRVVPFLETTRPMYHRIQDCLIYENNAVAEDAPSYLMAVYEKNKRVLGKAGIRLFAPGDVERASHYKIADYLSSQGFAVVVLNGERKEVRIPGRPNPISLGSYISDSSSSEEIGKEIAKIYHDNNLSHYPFAITGHLCLGRGITFQNDQFIFTHGIIFTISDKANAYQTACRLAGNIKHLPNYNEPHLHTTSKMLKIILEKEETAINIARLVAERDLSHVDQEFLNGEFGHGKVGVNQDEYDASWEEFSTFEQAKAKYPSIHSKEFFEDEQGNKTEFYKSSFDGKATKLSYDDIMRAKAGKKTANMPNNMKPGQTIHRLYVSYKDINDPSTAVFVVRCLTRKETTTTNSNI